MSRRRRGRLALAFTCVAACSGPGNLPRDAADAPWLGQPPPGDIPAVFASGVVSTAAIELNSVFTPDGREFLFTRVVDGVFTMYRCVRGEHGWSAPSALSLYADGARATAVDMAVSPDGTELVFLGEHAHEHASGEPGRDLWLSRRAGGEWSTAGVLPPPVSTPAEEIYATVVADGSLYFSSNRPDGTGKNQLYRSQRLAGGGFGEPLRVGPPIEDEAGVGDTFVSADERTMVFSSRRAPSAGRGDLFASFRAADGSWSEPANLGAPVNSAEHEFCPALTSDGRYLFFSRRYGGESWETTTGGDVFWVDARVLERFRPGAR